MEARKTERLLNLVICLLATRRFLTAEQVRAAVPGYAESSDEAFKRMFERDKEELRELGIPLELGTNSSWDDEPGYRIARRAYELPDISLTADEAAAVGLAARLWGSAALADATSSALVKLRAAGIEVDSAAAPGFEPRVDVAEPAFEPLLAALRAGRSVRFDYRGSGRAPRTSRHVDPWGVVSWHGRWYLAGHDRDRGAPRVFRLSRITGEVAPAEPVQSPAPGGTDLRSLIADWEHASAPVGTARIRVRAGAAWSLRRNALDVEAALEPAWDTVTVPFHDIDGFADWLCGYGPDVVALEPAELRDAVVLRLRKAADGAHEGVV